MDRIFTVSDWLRLKVERSTKNIANLVNLRKKFSLYREDAEYFSNFDSEPVLETEIEHDLATEPETHPENRIASFTSLLYMSSEYIQE